MDFIPKNSKPTFFGRESTAVNLSNLVCTLSLGNTICIRCINTYLLDKEDANSSSEFKCFMCEDTHDYPKNKCFPTNQPLLKLLNSELNNNSSFGHSSYSDTQLDKFKACMKSIRKEKSDIDSYVASGVEKIQAHCLEVKASIEAAAENSISSIRRVRDDLVNELNAYESDTVEFYEQNKSKPRAHIDFQAIHDEIDQLEASYAKYDAIQALDMALELKQKLDKAKDDLEKTLFNGSLIQFSAGLGEIEAGQVGFFSYNASSNLNLSTTMTPSLNNMTGMTGLGKKTKNLFRKIPNKIAFALPIIFSFYILNSKWKVILTRPSAHWAFYPPFYPGTKMAIKTHFK